jgi:hypothetical protein
MCHSLCRGRVAEEIRRRIGTPAADHLRFVLSIIDGCQVRLRGLRCDVARRLPHCAIAVASLTYSLRRRNTFVRV